MAQIVPRTTHRLLLSLAAFSSLALSRSPGEDRTRELGSVLRQYESFIEKGLAEIGAPGAAVAVVAGDSVVYCKGFGVREIGRPEPVDTHTVFRLSSVSKGFAPVLAGILVDEGVVSWDDPVARYLPGFALHDSASTAELSIEHVLSHRTGLPSHAFTNLIDDNVPYDLMVAELRDVALVCSVGECFSYQNVAYSLIGDVVEAATGESFSQLLQEKVFRPLSMIHASTGREAFVSNPNHASPHIRYRGRWLPTRVKNAYYSVPPAAGVNASIHDLGIWLQAQLGGHPDVVSESTLAQVQRKFSRTSTRRRYFHRWRRLRRAYYGLGWRIFDYSGITLVYHGGYVQGFRSEIAYSPELGIGLALLMNSATSLANRCVPGFFDLYLESIRR